MSASNSKPPVPRDGGCKTARHSLLLALLCSIALAGCVTVPDQITSEAESERFRQLVDVEGARQPDPLQFRARAEEMIETPLSFWGRVIDEDGEPVPSATITVYAFDRLLDPFTFPYFARTTLPNIEVSRQGRFKIRRLKAAGLLLVASASGYVAGEEASRLYFPDDPALAEGGERASPVVFELRRRRSNEVLQPVHSGARLLPAEAPLAVNVRGFDPLTPNADEGDVVIRCDRPPVDERQPPFTWSCTLAVPGGGVQPLGLNFDQAPTEGYRESFRLTMDGRKPNWQPRGARDLVVRFPDGTVGRYRFMVRLEGRDYVALDGVWNPSGSPALR